MTNESARQFNPLDLPPGVPAKGEFIKWFLLTREHHKHEFLELRRRLASVARSLTDEAARYFEEQVFRDAWRAATWDPRASWLRDYKVGTETPIGGFQLGPFLYLPREGRPPFAGRTRRPTTAALLAARLHIACKSLGLPIDWLMISMLTTIAEVPGHAEPDTLRVSASRIIKAVNEEKALPVAWPQDIGNTLESLEAFTARHRHP